MTRKRKPDMAPQHRWRKRRLIALQSVVLFSRLAPQNEVEKFRAHIAEASMEVDQWPDWKRRHGENYGVGGKTKWEY